MAGIGAGWGDYGGSFQKAPTTAFAKPPSGVDAGPSATPAPTPAPMAPPPNRNMGGGMNVGRTSKMGIGPSPMDPYRTYGSVSGGRMTPPQNPYGQNQPIRFTPGGEFGGGGPGPIDIGPSPYGQTQRPNTGGGGGYYQPGQQPIPPPSPSPMQVPGPRDYNMGMPQIPPNSYLPGGVTGNVPTPGNVPIETGPSNPWLERGGFTGGGMPPDIGSETSGASTGYYQPPSMIPNMSPMDTPRGRGGLGQMYGGAGPSLSGSFKRGMFY